MTGCTRSIALALLLLAGCATAPFDSEGQVSADLIIRGGTVIDGTGAPGRTADVAIKAGRILAVGRGLAMKATTSVDARGLVVAPGFIDGHSHSDTSLEKAEGRFSRNIISQGVTTVVGGADGGYSPKAMETLLGTYAKHGIGTNVALYVGHNGIRREVLGQDQNRAPTAAELAKMKTLARRGMDLGAVGLSSGLMYSPGLFSTTEEVAEVASGVAPDGLYETHVRDPHRGLLKSNAEAIEIGRKAGIPVLLTHLTSPGRQNRGIMKSVVSMIEEARRAGVKVVADQYPYPAVKVVTLWEVIKYPASVARNREGQRAALRDPRLSKEIREETLTGGKDGFSQYKASGADSLLILSCPGCEKYENKFIADIADERKIDGYDVVVDLLLNAPTDKIVVSLGGFYEEDVQYLLRQPWTMIASDGAGDYGLPASTLGAHPRSYGTFPRILGRYVRELKLLSLPDAIRKMTSATADFLGLKGRGRIAPGMAADLAIFDPATIADRATWKSPTELSVGVRHVLVNGTFVLRDGAFANQTPGMFLKKGQAEGVMIKP